MKTFVNLLVFSFFTVTLFYSCKKDSANNDTTAVTDNAIAEGESNRVIQAVNTAADNSDVRATEGDSLLPACATVTIDTTSFHRSIIVDFGSTPCLCADWDGKYRQGKITATWTGLYRDSGTVITIYTDKYFQGALATQMNQFYYYKTVTNLGHNASGNLHYRVDVFHVDSVSGDTLPSVVTLFSGQTIKWISQRDREWTAGESTFLPFDDVYSITGSASGTDRNANPFSALITSPLVVKLNCPWISQGTLKFTHGNLPEATLIYGDGTCDDLATITMLGISTTITLL